MPQPTGRVNLEQVAAEAGVSRATVSRVVNGRASVDPALRHRVQSAVDRLGYVPNAAARALATRRTGTVALVAAEPDERVFGDPFFAGIVRGVSSECLRTGLQMMLLMARGTDELARVETYLRSTPVEGVLLISEHRGHDPLPRAMREAGVPVVIGGRSLTGEPVPNVDNDNVGGGRIAAEHLLGLRRRAVGHLAGPQDMAAGVDRLAGFSAALGEAFDPDRVEPGDFTQAGGAAAARRLLARHPDLDALFAANDLMALGALRALREAGRRVPQDVAVVGFDDIEAAATAEPPLTTVRQRTVVQGRAMVRVLLGIARPEVPTARDEDLPGPLGDHVVLPVELVVRESA